MAPKWESAEQEDYCWRILERVSKSKADGNERWLTVNDENRFLQSRKSRSLRDDEFYSLSVRTLLLT